MDEDRIIETNPIKMYEIPRNDQMDNKENIVLRSLVGDPNRHTPLADHRPSSTISAQETKRSSMYTRETRYQPMPSRVLPQKAEPNVYYIGSRQRDDSPFTNENRESPFRIQPEKQSANPVVFLEPKVLSQPIFYSIATPRTAPIVDQPISINRAPPSPIIYSVSNRPRRQTIDIRVNNAETPTPIIDKSPTLYSMIGSPRHENLVQEPTKQFLQPTANLYSVVGTSARTSRGVQVSTPTPIVYTIVDDKPAPTNKPPPTSKNQSTDVTMYALDKEVNIRQAQQQQPIIKPSLYALVGRPNSPPEEIRAKPPPRKKTPPPQPITTVPTRRISRSLEQKPAAINEEIVTYPITKTKRQPKEPIPLNDDEYRSRPQIAHQPVPPYYTTPEQINRKPFIIAQHQPIELSNYNSPYAYRTHKPYRERKYNNNPLPVIAHTNSERKPRPPLHEPRYRVERNNPVNSTSLERYPVNTKSRPGLWNEGYQTQTDDDEDYDQKINKKKRNYGAGRTRAAWIPVW